MREARVLTPPVWVFIAAIYIVSGLILYFEVGPWESVRHSLMDLMLLVIWILLAQQILRSEPVSEPFTFKRPAAELGLLALILLGMMLTAILRYLGILSLPTVVYLALSAGAVILIHLISHYPASMLGLNFPRRSGWLAVLAVIIVNILFAIPYRLLPAGEAVVPPGADLAEAITGPMSLLLLLGGLLLRAAIPEELVFRVGLQPRLAVFLGIGFAIVFQALTFSAAHLPQQVMSQGKPLLLAIAYVLPIENGVIAGYIWYRTRSLPLLFVLHLFAFPRIGR